MRIRSTLNLAASLTAALLVGAVPAAPAVATGTVFDPLHHPAGVRVQRVGGTFNINGYNWGGYAATGTFTSVAASWTETAVKCNSRNDLYAPWVGIDGYSSSTVEQTGVETDCSTGSPVYQAWYEMYPANPVYLSKTTYPVGSTDSIHASVTAGSSHKYTLVLSDTTKGWTYTVSKTLSSAKNASAEAIIESPTGAYPNFGTLKFSSVTANGSAIGNYSPVAMDPSNGVYEAHASALSGGNSFTMTYEHE